MSGAVLREVRAGDWQALNDLHRWAWFPERSERGWSWLHRGGRGFPGWVLEDAEGVCGHLGNIRQDYALGEARLQGATGYSLIVLPRAKGGSRALLNAFRSQPGVFAATILNGNALSAPIYAREGFVAAPGGWADAKMVWPLAPVTILSERIARSVFHNRRPSRELFSGPMGAPTAPGRAELIELDPWSGADGIDRFNARLRDSGRLVADRSAAALQYRFSDPDRTAPPLLYGWRDEAGLAAMALGQVGKMTEREAPVLDVIDVAWLEPHGAGAATALLAHLRTVGRQLGASRMRLALVNSATAAVARGAPGAMVRRGHVHAHMSFVADEGLEHLWAPTPYDGDFGFCLRPPPVERPAPGAGDVPLAGDQPAARRPDDGAARHP